MKVIVINGSPNLSGNTAAGLDVVSHILQKSEIDLERIEIGREVLHSCTARARALYLEYFFSYSTIRIRQ
jgi:multimeric flavodoxin WrbA